MVSPNTNLTIVMLQAERNSTVNIMFHSIVHDHRHRTISGVNSYDTESMVSEAVNALRTFHLLQSTSNGASRYQMMRNRQNRLGYGS
ncbi:hypothetical protein TNCV_2348781 [Trichonephila clavipes]|uniref:Uncharacterized protein n=1 Tax=Trichonephila clavipes TaxID=2585209 RepID=A0A8X6T0N2_TRICX|nr:hypothetical protein TNCV_2348781 [Trichonephila clavipes]